MLRSRRAFVCFYGRALKKGSIEPILRRMVSYGRFGVEKMVTTAGKNAPKSYNVHGGAFVHGAAFVHARDLRCNHPTEDHNTTTTAPNAIKI
jgi:hypothetical protein